MIPSTKEKLREAKVQQKIRQENQQLQTDNEYLRVQLKEERSFSAQLLEGVGAALDFLEEHLPEPLRPLVEKAQQLSLCRTFRSRNRSRSGAIPGRAWNFEKI